MTKKGYLRIVIDDWDDTYFYASTEDLPYKKELKICYCDTEHTTFNVIDYSYLKEIIHRGATLNLINPHLQGDVLTAEMFIYEPDYLVNTSSVARCFTQYAESPVVHLLDKIRSSKPSSAILLGNLASQLLDEELHGTFKSYQESAKTFYSNNALDILYAKKYDQQFDNRLNVNEIKRQFDNIKHAFETLENNNALYQFDRKKGIVEPSFFSEMLGLQGRMDFLQSDFSILFEQKSGKGRFPQGSFDTPNPIEEHYVQLLLYMIIIQYNFKEAHKRNGNNLHSFLLYSKYKNALLDIKLAPNLIFRAIKVRNGIAWTDIQNAKGNFSKRIKNINAETINEKNAGGKLWMKYQKPEIEALLEPIKTASLLEQAYFLRFFEFISMECFMAKTGKNTYNKGFSSRWNDSLDQKLEDGSIFHCLTLDPQIVSEGKGVTTIILHFCPTKTNDIANFRTGDTVILYPYMKGSVPDIRKSMTFRCNITEIKSNTITLALRTSQSSSHAFLCHDNAFWAIEHDFIESSFTALSRAMHIFLCAPKVRRDLFLLQRSPRIDSSLQLNGDYKEFNEMVLRAKRARDFFLIIGPPGTGKTSFGLINTLLEEYSEAESNILLLSYTNRAVDEICQKLSEKDIDFIRLGHESSTSSKLRDHLLYKKICQCNNIESFEELIMNTRVFVSTVATLNKNSHFLNIKAFSLAIIDEASQILEPYLVGLFGALCNGEPAIKRVIFIGDHKQLPAVVLQDKDISRTNDPLLNNIGIDNCRQTMFERLLKRYSSDPNVTYMLTEQGRMHAEIANFPSSVFYENKLRLAKPEKQNAPLIESKTYNDILDYVISTKRFAFISIHSPKETPSKKVNLNEAKIIALMAEKIYNLEKDNFDPNKTLGIIVPYRNQITTIKTIINQYNILSLDDITIDTVERFQGSQRKNIIYGFTVNDLAQLDFLAENRFIDTNNTLIDRKLNVAMTRAKERLIIIGNADLLTSDPLYLKLINYTKQNQAFFSLSEEFIETNIAKQKHT